MSANCDQSPLDGAASIVGGAANNHTSVNRGLEIFTANSPLVSFTWDSTKRIGKFTITTVFSGRAILAAALVVFSASCRKSWNEAASSPDQDTKPPFKNIFDLAWDQVTKSPEQKAAEAKFKLGAKYANGDGVVQNYAEAVKLYREAAEQKLPEAQNELGVCYAKGLGVTQDDFQASTWFQRAAEQGYFKAQFNLGFEYQKQIQEMGLAIDDLDFPFYAKAVSEAIRWYKKAAAQGDIEAESNLKRLFESAPDWKRLDDYARSSNRPNADDFYRRGIRNHKDRRYDFAIKDYTESIRLQPDRANAYYNRGVAKGAKGDLDGAIADFTKSIELKPDYAEAYNNRGNAKQAKGDSDGAIADYSKAVELKPDFAEAYNNRGVAKHAKGDFDGEKADRTKAIELKPGAEMLVEAAEESATPAEDLVKAAERGDAAAVLALLAKGAKVNAKSNDGRTALIGASENGQLEVVRTLLAKGADVNATTSSGATALSLAAQQGYPETVQTLLAKGADVNAKTSGGATALSLAKDVEVRTLLIQAGAKSAVAGPAESSSPSASVKPAPAATINPPLIVGTKIRSGCLPGEQIINGIVTSVGEGTEHVYSIQWEGISAEIQYSDGELKQNLDSGEFKLLHTGALK